MLRLKCVVAVFLVVFHCTESQVLSGCSEAIKGKSCLLTCTTPDFNESVLFRKTSRLFDLGACYPAAGLCEIHYPSKIYQSSGSTFETYLKLLSLSHREEDSYTCEYGYKVSNSVTIIVRTIPSNMTITLNTTDPIPQEIRGMADCVYPNNVTMELIFRDGDEDNVLGQFTPSYEGPGSGTRCESHEYQVSGTYHLTSDTINNTLAGKVVQFKIRITVLGLSVSQESSLSESIVFLDTLASTTTTIETSMSTPTTEVLGFGRGDSGTCRPSHRFVVLMGLLYLIVQLIS